jgi:tetratricopeptide (TPR) repeat protein
MMVERYPARPYGYKLEGDCSVRMKQYEEAVEWYAKSLDVAEQQGRASQVDFFQAFRDMGFAYRKLKRPDEAIAAYRQALNLKPHDVNILYNLQYLYRIQGRYKEAYAAVKEILRVQPDHSGARRLVPYLQSNVYGSIGG